jgi:hypothetical protein
MLLLPSAFVAVYVGIRRKWVYAPVLAFSLKFGGEALRSPAFSSTLLMCWPSVGRITQMGR